MQETFTKKDFLIVYDDATFSLGINSTVTRNMNMPLTKWANVLLRTD